MVFFYIAAACLLGIGVAHSYLGEKYILIRLFRRQDLPKIRGSAEFTMRTLRFAWHITSLAWLGFAGLLVVIAHPPAAARSVAWVIAVTFFAHGALALGGSRGRHYSWIVFLAVGVLTLIGGWGL
jgi:hypothetical protein